MIEEKAKDYFSKDAFAWMNNAYQAGEYNYPAPVHRIRVIKKLLEKKKIKTVLDVGCGGAYVSIELAKMGYNITAIDQSKEMLSIATENISKESKAVQGLITLKKSKIDDQGLGSFDCVIAMGLIGYLENDEKFFKIANANLKKGGYLLVSFRNRLFNLFSIGYRTVNESKSGHLEKLISEANSYYKNIDTKKVRIFLSELQRACSAILASQDDSFAFSNSSSIPYSVNIEPRQSTPQDAETAATKFGFCAEKFVGIHPHFAVPGLNKLLPPMVYNKICDCFNVLEDEKIAMLWSSMFIGAFVKQ